MRPGTLEPAKHPMSRLQPRLDSQELLPKRPVRIRRDVGPRLMARLAMGFDALGGKGGVVGKVVCAGK